MPGLLIAFRELPRHLNVAVAESPVLTTTRAPLPPAHFSASPVTPKTRQGETERWTTR